MEIVKIHAKDVDGVDGATTSRSVMSAMNTENIVVIALTITNTKAS